MNLDIVMKMAHSPVRNYAIPGLTSWMISSNPDGNIRLFEMTRNHIEPISPHSHRFDFHCIVLEGEVENIIYEPARNYWNGDFPIDVDAYSELISTYNGEIGSYTNSRSYTKGYKIHVETYGTGDQYSMTHDQIHSIRFKKGTKVLFFEGPEKTNSSIVLEPFVDNEIIPTFKVEPWMFKSKIKENMLEVNDSNFEEEVLNSPIPVLVDFWADWCVPCKQMMPALESLEQERTDVKFVKFQSTRESEIVKKYGIRSVPTLMVFHTGAVIGTKTGSSTKDQIIKLLDISLNPLG